MGTDYLGASQPLTVGGRATLPVGGASAGAGPATTPSMAGAPGGGLGAAGVPVGQAVTGGGGSTGQGGLAALQQGLRGVDIARRFASNIPGAPLGVPTSDILEGGPSGAPVYGPSRASVPAPTFGGPGSEGLSGALETSVPMGADAAQAGGSLLGSVGEVLPLVGPTIGMIPQWAQGRGGPPFGADSDTAGLDMAALMAASAANPATLFGVVGAGAISGLLETAGVVDSGTPRYQAAREQDAFFAQQAIPDYINQILATQSPEELAERFRSGFAGAPGERGRLRFDFQPDYSDIATSGLRLKQPQIEQVNVALEQAAQYQMAVLEGARMGNPQAIELLQSATQAQQGRRDAAAKKRAEDEALAALPIATGAGEGP